MDQCFAASGAPFDASSLREAAALLGVDTATILAIAEVETDGCGFLADRRPQLRFERHIFHRLTGGRFDAVAPTVSARRPGGYGAGSASEYDRLALATQLDDDAALRSASWGLGQIMGFNAGLVGYDDPGAMVAAFVRSEGAQLVAIARYCVQRQLADDLRARDWSAFARAYNGPSFHQNRYDTKLAAAYARLRGGTGVDLRLRTLQVYLMYLGFYSGRIDGLGGPRTNGAIAAFQAHAGLGGNTGLDHAMQAAIEQRYRALIRHAA